MLNKKTLSLAICLGAISASSSLASFSHDQDDGKSRSAGYSSGDNVKKGDVSKEEYNKFKASLLKKHRDTSVLNGWIEGDILSKASKIQAKECTNEMRMQLYSAMDSLFTKLSGYDAISVTSHLINRIYELDEMGRLRMFRDFIDLSIRIAGKNSELNDDSIAIQGFYKAYPSKPTYEEEREGLRAPYEDSYQESLPAHQYNSVYQYQYN